MSALHSRSSSDDFSPEEVEVLEHLRIFLSPVVDGKRRVSTTAFAPPEVTGVSSSSSSSGSSSASFTVRGFAPVVQGATVDLPCAVESSAGLEFIGFTPQAAEEIFTKWSARPDPDINPDELLDYAYSHIRGKDRYGTSPGRETMTRMGISTNMQDALTDPAFADIAGTETQQFWICDTLRVNYLTLLQLKDRLSETAARNKAKTKETTATQPPPGPPFIASSVPTTTATLNVASEHFNLPAAHVAVAEPTSILPDHYVLYKGKAVCDIEGFILDNGDIEMAGISTRPGGDFNHKVVAWYWSPESETAEQYRKWAERRSPWSETCLIRIQAPKALINGMKKEELWYSPDWKEYVWYCRTKTRPPAKFSKYWQEGQADLIKGHICAPLGKIPRIKKEDVQTEMNEGMVLHLENGAKATQWVFMSFGSVNALEQEVRGKVHIDITAPAQVQD